MYAVIYETVLACLKAQSATVIVNDGAIAREVSAEAFARDVAGNAVMGLDAVIKNGGLEPVAA